MTISARALASVLILGAAPAAFAQDPGRLLAIAESGVAKLAGSEWSKLPQGELDCVNQKLAGRGDSVQALAQRGILPGDAPVADIRSLCRSSAALEQASPPTKKYSVDGLALGSRVNADVSAFRDYKCGPSEQFDGFAWCQRTRSDRGRRGPFAATYSVLHAQNGTVVYVNRRQEPSFLTRSEADRDIQGYSREIGEPARITRSPHRAGVPDGMIAIWGKATLEPLDQDSIKILAEGKSPKKGFLVDFIGNFPRSAKEGLPIYRIAGGAGFLWSASFDQTGRGTLRLLAVDASGLYPPVPAQASPAQASTVVASAAPEPQNVSEPAPEKVNSVDPAGKISNANPNQPLVLASGPPSENLDTLVLAQYDAQKASLDAKSSARGNAIIGLVVLFLVATFWHVMKSRRRAKQSDDLTESATVAPAKPQATLPDFSAAASAPAVPESIAAGGEQRLVENKPVKSFDDGAMVNQLAHTLGVQEPTGSAPQLACVPCYRETSNLAGFDVLLRRRYYLKDALHLSADHVRQESASILDKNKINAGHYLE